MLVCNVSILVCDVGILVCNVSVLVSNALLQDEEEDSGEEVDLSKYDLAVDSGEEEEEQKEKERGRSSSSKRDHGGDTEGDGQMGG